MNGKMKTLIIAALAAGLIASAIYVVPTLAYMNGTTDQTRDQNQDQDQTGLRDRDCVCDCTCDGTPDQNQTRTRLHLQECVQNQQFMEQSGMLYQYQHQYQYRNGNMGSP
jgi:hypothetical protein